MRQTRKPASPQPPDVPGVHGSGCGKCCCACCSTCAQRPTTDIDDHHRGAPAPRDVSGASQTAAAEHQQQTRAAVLLLTVPQAAEMLGVGRSTVYGLISGGALNSVRVGGSRRIPVPALQAYVAGLLPVQPPRLPAVDR